MGGNSPFPMEFLQLPCFFENCWASSNCVNDASSNFGWCFKSISSTALAIFSCRRFWYKIYEGRLNRLKKLLPTATGLYCNFCCTASALLPFEPQHNNTSVCLNLAGKQRGRTTAKVTVAAPLTIVAIVMVIAPNLFSLLGTFLH